MKDLAGRLLCREDEAHLLTKGKESQSVWREQCKPSIYRQLLARNMVVSRKDCFTGEPCGNHDCQGAGVEQEMFTQLCCFVKFPALGLELVWEETG